VEARDNRAEGRAATFIKRTKQGKVSGLPPQGKAQPRTRQARRVAPARLDHARKLRRTLYRVAKQQTKRRFTLLYDKVCRQDILQEAWQRVKSNKGAAGVDQGGHRCDPRLWRSVVSERTRTGTAEPELSGSAGAPGAHTEAGQPGKTRPLGIPTVKDRVTQMAVKLVIEPLFEADFLPCSFGLRPKRTPRMALSAIVQSINEGFSYVVDVDLKILL
jgi:RNA-directed DNA polymerase